MLDVLPKLLRSDRRYLSPPENLSCYDGCRRRCHCCHFHCLLWHHRRHHNHGISVEIVWHKLEIVPQEDTFGQRAVHAAHICCATARTAACETALDAIFAPSRKTGFPLDTIFRCFQNTGSDHVGMLSTKDKARSATLRELHRKQVQDSAKLVELYPHMLTPLNLPGSRTLKQFLQGRRTLDTRPLFLDISPTKDCEGYYTFTILKEHKAEAREVLSSLVMLCREVHGDESKVWFTEDQWARCDEPIFRMKQAAGSPKQLAATPLVLMPF